MASVLSTHFRRSLKPRGPAVLPLNAAGPNTKGGHAHTACRLAPGDIKRGKKKTGDLQGGRLNERPGACVYKKNAAFQSCYEVIDLIKRNSKTEIGGLGETGNPVAPLPPFSSPLSLLIPREIL